MPSVRSAPLAQTCSPSTRISEDSASAVIAAESWGSRPRSAANLVIARYIRPLSPKGIPSFSATRRPTADLPDATPPSIAMIMSRPSLRIEPDRSPQRCDLQVTQHAPAAGFQAPELQGTKCDATQRFDPVADGEHHAADLPLAALANHHSELGMP